VKLARRPARRSVAAVMTVASALVLGGCIESGRTSGGAASGTTCPFEADPSVTATARIAYQNIPNGDLVVKDQQMLEKCLPNAKITWSKFDSGADVIQAFGSGSVDIGLIGSSPATKALSKPLLIPMRVVWVHDVIGEAESLVVRDKSIKTVADLKGKKIAVPFSSTAHFSLIQALGEAGLDPRKGVSLINLAPDKMPAAWQGGQVDAAYVWDPTLSVLKKDGQVLTSSKETAKRGVRTYDLGAATTKFIEANPKFMAVWARAQDVAVKQILARPDQASVSVAAVLGIPPADVKKQFAGFEFLDAKTQSTPAYLGGKLGTDLGATAMFLLDQGGIEAMSAGAAYPAGVDPEPAAGVR
jgi:taurine transport system substrate-binding protein